MVGGGFFDSDAATDQRSAASINLRIDEATGLDGLRSQVRQMRAALRDEGVDPDAPSGWSRLIDAIRRK